MALSVETLQAPIRIDDHGVAWVGGTRVTLDTIVNAFHDGASAEEIVARYDSLDLADVYAAIAYYLQNKSEVDAYLREREQRAQVLREEIERRFPSHALREKLLARRAARAVT